MSSRIPTKSRVRDLRSMYYVYILSNRLRTVFYIGVTNNLIRRVYEHKEKLVPGFTSWYQINELLFYEPYHSIYEAISREQETKGWRREKKLALVKNKTQLL